MEHVSFKLTDKILSYETVVILVQRYVNMYIASGRIAGLGDKPSCASPLKIQMIITEEFLNW